MRYQLLVSASWLCMTGACSEESSAVVDADAASTTVDVDGSREPDGGGEQRSDGQADGGSEETTDDGPAAPAPPFSPEVDASLDENEADGSLDEVDASQNSAAPLLATKFDIINGSGTVRSRAVACQADAPRYGIQREGIPSGMACKRILCDALPRDEVVDDRSCADAMCPARRFDLQPGEADPFVWNGDFAEVTARGCFERVPVVAGAPMVARICWGAPSGPVDIVDWQCDSVRFAYGTPQVTLTLR